MPRQSKPQALFNNARVRACSYNIASQFQTNRALYETLPSSKTTHMQNGCGLLHPGYRLVQQLLQRQRLALQRPQFDGASDLGEVGAAAGAAAHRLQRVPVVLQVRPVHTHVLRLGRGRGCVSVCWQGTGEQESAVLQACSTAVRRCPSAAGEVSARETSWENHSEMSTHSHTFQHKS